MTATGSGVSVVVPTYREAQNLPLLVERLASVRDRALPDLELWVMDDDSRDGTVEWARDAPEWVELVVRTSDRGLSPAVIDGIANARGSMIVVMDADLSHPPESVPDLVAALEHHDFVIGSRYVEGGSTDEDWGALRAFNSWVATVLARPLTDARDPMAGFIAFRASLLDGAAPLDPIGFKIGLELMVKCRVRSVGEVPIRFANRHAGRSKLNLGEQWRYLRHLVRLYRFRWSAAGRRRPAG